MTGLTWCSWLCVSRRSFCPKPFPQCSQVNPVIWWRRFKWIFSVLFWAVAYSQYIHLYGFSPEIGSRETNHYSINQDAIVREHVKLPICVLNSLTPGRWRSNFKSVISEDMLRINTLYEIALRRMSLNTFDYRSTLPSGTKPLPEAMMAQI